MHPALPHPVSSTAATTSMTSNALPTMTAFSRLPIELNKMIGEYLEHEDMENFAFICVATRDAAEGDQLSLWRTKWRRRFALLEGSRNLELRDFYKHRTKYLKKGMTLDWAHGTTSDELGVVGVLRSLIVHSWRGSVKDGQHLECPNMEILDDFANRSLLIFGGRRPPKPTNVRQAAFNNSLGAVRLMCGHFTFGQDRGEDVVNIARFDDSQISAYMPRVQAPLFVGIMRNQVNMKLLWDLFNFFQYHSSTNFASSLPHALRCLHQGEKPSPWSRPLTTGVHPLSWLWKGTFGCMESDDLLDIRQLQARAPLHQRVDYDDLVVGDGELQELQLKCSTDFTASWPDHIERVLRSKRPTLFVPRIPANVLANPPPAPSPFSPSASLFASNLPSAYTLHPMPSNMLQITGSCLHNGYEYFITGFVSALPGQGGIEGWQRITFMKHSDLSLDLSDPNELWAYEGVVLPGGKMMYGRWWYVRDEEDPLMEDSGPFVFWACRARCPYYHCKCHDWDDDE